MEILLILGIGGYGLYYLAVHIEGKMKYKKEIAEVEKEYMQWLLNEEPRYRSYHTYPPDWHFRKLGAQKRDQYKCQICGKTVFYDAAKLKRAIETRRHTMWTELHVHHKIPLSKGGDNSLDNLICLCEECHENQHPHMLKKRIAAYRLKAKRARKSSSIAYWNDLVSTTEERLEKANRL